MKSVPCTTISVPPLAGPLVGDRLTSVGRGTRRKVTAAVSASFPAVSAACGVMTIDRVVIGRDGRRSKWYLQGAWWGPGRPCTPARRLSDVVADRRAQGAEEAVAVIGDECDGDVGSRRDEAARDRTFDVDGGRLRVGAEREEAAIEPRAVAARIGDRRRHTVRPGCRRDHA